MSDDPLTDLLGDDEEPSGDAPDKPKHDSQLQTAQRKLQKAEKELEELRAYKAERDTADRHQGVSQAFTSLGLNPKHAKFFPKDTEVTEDAVRAWAVAEDFLVENPDQPTPEAPTPGFTPTVISEGQALGARFYTFEEYEEVRRQDPAKADQLRRAGRVQAVSKPWTEYAAGA